LLQRLLLVGTQLHRHYRSTFNSPPKSPSLALTVIEGDLKKLHEAEFSELKNFQNNLSEAGFSGLKDYKYLASFYLPIK
jgi:hypothetical protein